MALTLICTPILVAAHGSGQHVLGVVTAIDAVISRSKRPKASRCPYDSRTKPQYKAKNLRRTKNTPQVGDRVVIEAEKDDNGLIATEVHFSDSKPKPALHSQPCHVRVSRSDIRNRLSAGPGLRPIVMRVLVMGIAVFLARDGRARHRIG